MAIPLHTLSVSTWDQMKAPFGKTPKLKAIFTGTASVGPALKSYIDARTAWEHEVANPPKTLPTAMKYFGAANKLKEAFAKFETLKDLTSTDTQTQTMKAAVHQWKNEAAALVVSLAQEIKNTEGALKTGRKDQLSGVTKGMGIGGL